MKFKHGDMVEVEGYLGEVIKVTESYIEVLYGGEALHYCVEKYDINDDRIVLSNNANHKKPNSDQLSGEVVEGLLPSFSFLIIVILQLFVSGFSCL